MTILPVNPADNASPDALRAFLRECQAAAVRAGRPQLVSISVAVEALDPLAVLESIFEPAEPHFYVERPSATTAIAGAEVALSFEAKGPERFGAVQAWVREVLQHTIAVGDVRAPFGGPHFFGAFAFADAAEPGEPFPPAFVFVPRWQVGLSGSTTTAVANLLVAPDGALEPLVERVWRAHRKFRNFDYGVEREAPPSAPTGSGAEQPGISRREVGDYRAAVRAALQGIEAGELRKVVLARAQDVAAPRVFHPLEMLNGLRERFPDCYAFSVSHGGGTSFIGASPERLVRVMGGRLETEALAGSARRGATATEDAALAAALLRSDKDLREQREVLEDIVARLERLGCTPSYASTPQVRRLANVQHLWTTIGATLPAELGLLEVVGVMHPTPAVGGQPREQALPRIRTLEGFPRGLYAGALGWINAVGDGEFFVGIRSALVSGAHARVFAGAGIVAGSDPEKEFAETELKFRAMLDAFRI